MYSSLTIHYIDNLNLLFSEFFRILKPGGIFIFSTDHPESPGLKANPVYERRVKNVCWSGFNVSLSIIQRPWNDIVTRLEQSGFKIDEIRDAQPTETCKQRFPEACKELKNNPHFISVRAIKQSNH